MKQAPIPAAPEPPGDLSERSKDLWRAVIHRALSPGRQILVYVALQALDRADQACALLQIQGLVDVTEKTGALHANPLLKVEKDNRALFARLWHDQLHLDWDPVIDGR